MARWRDEDIPERVSAIGKRVQLEGYWWSIGWHTPDGKERQPVLRRIKKVNAKQKKTPKPMRAHQRRPARKRKTGGQKRKEHRLAARGA